MENKKFLGDLERLIDDLVSLSDATWELIQEAYLTEHHEHVYLPIDTRILARHLKLEIQYDAMETGTSCIYIVSDCANIVALNDSIGYKSRQFSVACAIAMKFLEFRGMKRIGLADEEASFEFTAQLLACMFLMPAEWTIREMEGFKEECKKRKENWRKYMTGMLSDRMQIPEEYVGMGYFLARSIMQRKDELRMIEENKQWINKSEV